MHQMDSLHRWILKQQRHLCRTDLGKRGGVGSRSFVK
ncbi:hypothetical protein A2U01_0105662, partial [Trifolium medium]|nr:hypothetical protein [Trifolium medium]